MKLLEIGNYILLKSKIAEVTFNCFFARSVIENHTNGIVYVDEVDNPKNAYILHPYGMSLLMGDGKNAEFKRWLFEYMLNKKEDRRRDEWMQIFSDDWRMILEEELQERLLPVEKNNTLDYQYYIEVNTRVNFEFNKTRLRDKVGINTNKGIVVEKITKKTTLSMEGSVIPLNFWNNMNDFLKNGIGYSVFVNGLPVSTAFSSFVHGKFIEIGIETVEKYRGSGYAKLACGALIEYCINNQFTPIWSCRLGNKGSYNLAISLGFEPIKHLPYYRLCKNK